MAQKKKKKMNAKVAKMMEFIKTYGEYTCRFNFGFFFFQLHNPPLPVSAREK